MAAVIRALLGGLLTIAGSWVGRVLLSLGISFVVFQGVDLLLDSVIGLARNYFQALPSNILAIAGLLHVGAVFSIWASAFAAKMSILGITSAGFKKMVMK